jgi:hypothetical protein
MMRGVLVALLAPLLLRSGWWRTLLRPRIASGRPGARPRLGPGMLVLRLLARLPHSPWRTTCLFRSVVACAALRASGYDAVLRLGVQSSDDGTLAHAWVEDANSMLLFGHRSGWTALA